MSLGYAGPNFVDSCSIWLPSVASCWRRALDQIERIIDSLAVGTHLRAAELRNRLRVAGTNNIVDGLLEHTVHRGLGELRGRSVQVLEHRTAHLGLAVSLDAADSEKPAVLLQVRRLWFWSSSLCFRRSLN